MPATAPVPETAIFAPLPARRSAYQQVAVADADHYSTTMWWDEASQFVSDVRPAAYDSTQRRSAPPTPATNTHELRVHWVADRALREMESVGRQLAAKQPYYERIESGYVMAATALLTVWLWQQADPIGLDFTLTYDQSLHLRATLPQGVLHISVLFNPGLDPTQHLGQCEEEDNTVISLFDAAGRWQAGTEGPLLPCLNRLPDLLTAAASVPA